MILFTLWLCYNLLKNIILISVIDWVVEKRFKGILENNPHINQIHTVDLNKVKRNKSLKLLFIEVSKARKFGNYDVVIDLQGLIKSAIIAKFISK